MFRTVALGMLGLWVVVGSIGCREAAAEPPGPTLTVVEAPGARLPTPDADPDKAPSEAPDAGPLTITLSAIGDNTLGSDHRIAGAPGSFHEKMDQVGNDMAYPFSGVLSVLSKDDLTIGNLETPLSRAKPAVKHTFVFNGKPEYAQILKAGSVEIVTVANNHNGDFGPQGAEQTLAALRDAGVGAFGDPHVDKRVVKGVEIVNLGYLGGPKGTRDRVVKDVKKHKKPDNLVFVSFHWGVEGLNVPTDDQRKMGHAVLDAGADLVLGHHPHVLQGIETYHGKHIVYSLGNFVFGGHSNPADKDSMIYQEVFEARDGKMVPKENRILPVRISSVTTHNDFRPVLLEGEEKARVQKKVEDLSAKLK